MPSTAAVFRFIWHRAVTFRILSTAIIMMMTTSHPQSTDSTGLWLTKTRTGRPSILMRILCRAIMALMTVICFMTTKTRPNSLLQNFLKPRALLMTISSPRALIWLYRYSLHSFWWISLPVMYWPWAAAAVRRRQAEALTAPHSPHDSPVLFSRRLPFSFLLWIPVGFHWHLPRKMNLIQLLTATNRSTPMPTPIRERQPSVKPLLTPWTLLLPSGWLKMSHRSLVLNILRILALQPWTKTGMLTHLWVLAVSPMV